MKILVTPTSFGPDSRHPAKAILENFASEIVYNPYGRPLRANEIIDLLAGVHGYIAGLDFISEKVFQAAPPSLKVISRYGSGLDRVDLIAAGKRGIVVTHTPHANAQAVAELTFGLILSAARGIPYLDQAVRQGKWLRKIRFELYRKKLGIIGLGAIGKKVARFAKAFSMQVMAFDPYVDKDFFQKHTIETATLDEVVRQSDVITLHLPLTETTHHMIDAKRIAAMKSGVIIINTARFELFNEEDVADGLSTGRIGGIGLDVYREEPPGDLPFNGLDKVIYTPHCGAHTAEARQRMARAAVENLIDVITGRRCKNIVNAKFLPSSES